MELNEMLFIHSGVATNCMYWKTITPRKSIGKTDSKRILENTWENTRSRKINNNESRAYFNSNYHAEWFTQ